MTIGSWAIYKCTKCGFIFIMVKSDTFLPVVCPKCGGPSKKVISLNIL
jgi:putative FmdB family regulatory protein